MVAVDTRGPTQGHEIPSIVCRSFCEIFVTFSDDRDAGLEHQNSAVRSSLWRVGLWLAAMCVKFLFGERKDPKGTCQL